MKLESISVAGKDANQSGVGKKFFNNFHFYRSTIDKSFNRDLVFHE